MDSEKPARKAAAIKPRHDGFTPARRRKFFETLAKTGCIADGARRARISTTTVDRWRKRDAEFDRQCVAALEQAATSLETLAYDRAVHGVEEQVIREGKVVSVRKKPSDGIFRMVLQASNPRKYGRLGAVAKQTEKALRKQIEAEIAARHSEEDIEAVRQRIMKKLAIVRARLIRERGDIPLPSGACISRDDAAYLRALPGPLPAPRAEGDGGRPED